MNLKKSAHNEGDRLFKRFIGVVIKLTGFALVILGIIVAFHFFYKKNRALFINPEMATEVSLEKLFERPEKYYNKIVSVEGELWRAGVTTAVLVSKGSGSETLTDNEYDRFYQEPANKSKPLSPTRALPEVHIEVVHFEEGIFRTLSFIDIGNETVVIAGKFRKPDKEINTPYLEAIVMVKPFLQMYWASIVIAALIPLFMICLGFSIVYIGSQMTSR
ncbi:MAG: hypothetical protein L3V56_13290 [Candidatus Magnetoovum sp. WYHC-5]|nr:hypothetical protein [Candidatus Magnetoovum sp. WYHC-5]